MSATVRIGFHPLNDCALLAVAAERGFFEGEGVEVVLTREPSWSNIRDKLAYGLLDAAHVLAPMSIAAALGAGVGGATQLIAPMALGLNGNSVVAMRDLAGEIGDAQGPHAVGAAIAAAVRRREAAGAPQLVFGVPFPFSAHAYILRRWLAESGVDPERDVSIVVSPPVRMSSMARKGVIDAFCVGAPWPQATVLDGGGRLLFSDRDYWPDKPEKVLAVSAAWAKANPGALQAMLRALMRAALWADVPGNRLDLVKMLSDTRYAGAPAAHIAAAFSGTLAAGHVFAASHGTYPWPQHAAWFARQMVRWGHAPGRAEAVSLARAVYRPDLWSVAAAEIGLPAPAEGAEPPDAARLAVAPGEKSAQAG